MAKETLKSLHKTLSPARKMVKPSGMVKHHRDGGLYAGLGPKNISGEQYQI